MIKLTYSIWNNIIFLLLSVIHCTQVQGLRYMAWNNYISILYMINIYSIVAYHDNWIALIIYLAPQKNKFLYNIWPSYNIFMHFLTLKLNLSTFDFCLYFFLPTLTKKGLCKNIIWCLIFEIKIAKRVEKSNFFFYFH